MSADRLSEIQARHDVVEWVIARSVERGSAGHLTIDEAEAAHADRAWLLADLARLRAALEAAEAERKSIEKDRDSWRILADCANQRSSRDAANLRATTQARDTAEHAHADALSALAAKRTRAAALEAVLREMLESLNVCEGNRGRYSGVDSHDVRCPKSRADSPEKWRGEWTCECGSEAFDAAVNAARAALARPEGT